MALTLSLWFLNLQYGVEGFLKLSTYLPDVHDSDVILLHFDETDQIVARGFPIPCQFQNGSELLSLVQD